MTFDPRGQSARLNFGDRIPDPCVQCVGLEVDKKLNFRGVLTPLTSTITIRVSRFRFCTISLTGVTTLGVAFVFLLDFIANLLLPTKWRFPRWRLLWSWESLVLTHLRPHADADPRGFADTPAFSSPGVLWPIPAQLLHNENLKTHLFLCQMADVSWCEQSARAVPLIVTAKCSCELIIVWRLRHLCELRLVSFIEALLLLVSGQKRCASLCFLLFLVVLTLWVLICLTASKVLLCDFDFLFVVWILCLVSSFLLWAREINGLKTDFSLPCYVRLQPPRFERHFTINKWG